MASIWNSGSRLLKGTSAHLSAEPPARIPRQSETRGQGCMSAWELKRAQESLRSSGFQIPPHFLSRKLEGESFDDGESESSASAGLCAGWTPRHAPARVCKALGAKSDWPKATRSPAARSCAAPAGMSSAVSYAQWPSIALSRRLQGFQAPQGDGGISSAFRSPRSGVAHFYRESSTVA